MYFNVEITGESRVDANSAASSGSEEVAFDNSVAFALERLS